MTAARDRRSTLAVVLYAVAVAGFVTYVVSSLLGLDPEADGVVDLLGIALAFLAYATVGTLILVRQPGNRVGWLVGAVGFFPLVSGLTDVLVRRAPDWPLTDVARWYGAWYFFAALWTLPVLFLLFPDGRPASKRWRWPLLIAVVALVAELARYMFGPPDCGSADCGNESNPYQVAALRPLMGVLGAVGVVGFLVGLLAGAASLAWRFHRTRGVEREQVKWFAAAVGLAVLLYAVSLGLAAVWRQPDTLGNLGFAVMISLPAAGVAVAVLRYRLYDIDRVVSRTVTYALVSALLLGVYLALVTITTRLLPDGSSLAVAASTLAAAALFQPLRRRVQTLVDRRFNRARYDADRTVAVFSAQLREEVDLDTVRADLLTVVHDTVQPASVGLWLRNPNRATP